MQVPVASAEAERQFADLLEALAPEVQRKQMMGRPTLMAGRTMVACLNGDVLGIRLGRDTTVFADALAVGGAGVFTPGERRTFKDWVGIPVSSGDEWLRFTVAALEAAKRNGGG